ncbi:unnamed protein product [Penicillium manginii]
MVATFLRTPTGLSPSPSPFRRAPMEMPSEGLPNLRSFWNNAASTFFTLFFLPPPAIQAFHFLAPPNSTSLGNISATPRTTVYSTDLLYRVQGSLSIDPPISTDNSLTDALSIAEPTAPVHPSPPPPPPPPRSRLRRIAGFTTIAILAFTAGLTYQTSKTISHLMAAPPATADGLPVYTPVDDVAFEINEKIRTHPEAERLRANPDFKEARPHLNIPEPMRERMLTAGALSGPNKIVVPPYVFSERGGKSMVSLMYLGSDVCGHQGIVHGGLLATLLDEGFARCCFPAMPNKVGVTASLNIDYRAPALANNYFALRAETVRQEGRKAWVEGRIETLPEDGSEPIVLVEAKALFIEPKQAAAMAHLYRGATD